MQLTPSHEIEPARHLRIARRAVFNGDPIPPETDAVLTAWGYNTHELEVRLIDSQRFTQ